MANCPINEQTGDAVLVGRCWHHLEDGHICPRHGDVLPELDRFETTGELTIENDWRYRVGKPLLRSNKGKDHDKFIYFDAKADTNAVAGAVADADIGSNAWFRYRNVISVRRYIPDASVDRAKGLMFPTLRGTWLPSFDKQEGFGLAANWLGVRVRVSLSK